MPIVIGAKPQSDFADPIGLLTDCHRRIERFLSVLAQIGARAQGGALETQERSQLENALRYFREAAPKHTADEEQTLFPRLRSLDRPEVKAVFATLDSLERDHIHADNLHAEVDRLGLAWLDAGTLSSADAERFAALVGELEKLYRGHIALEERELFPAAAGVLEGPERRAMGIEMAARRGLRQGG